MTAEPRQHATAAEAAAALCGDPAMADRVRAHAAACQLVTMLMNLRLARGMTQTDIARRMNVSPSKVSKLEASNDASLRLGDIVAYVRAIGLETSISFEDPAIPATRLGCASRQRSAV